MELGTRFSNTHYKILQILLQNATTILLQNATEVYYKMSQIFYYKMRRFYYKMQQLLQNETFITNCGRTLSLFAHKRGGFVLLRLFGVVSRSSRSSRVVPACPSLLWPLKNCSRFALYFTNDDFIKRSDLQIYSK